MAGPKWSRIIVSTGVPEADQHHVAKTLDMIKQYAMTELTDAPPAREQLIRVSVMIETIEPFPHPEPPLPEYKLEVPA